MLSLAITGKKMNVTSLKPRFQDVLTPLLISQKPMAHPSPKIRKKITTGKVVNVQKSRASKNGKQGVKVQEVLAIKPSQIEVKSIKVEQSQVPLPKQNQVGLAEAKKEDIISSVIIRYNHYKQTFSARNGVLSFLPIEEKYCFADVFKGNFLPILKNISTMTQIQPITAGKAIQYAWEVRQAEEYRLQIQEDEQQENKYDKKAYKAPPESNNCIWSGKRRTFEELTEEIKRLEVSQLGGAKHRTLLQLRDLQDILYS